MLENENAETLFRATKITYLNTHCMEAIFHYLGFNDLLNVVESSKQFYTAACEVYKRKYAGQHLMFDRNRADVFLKYRYCYFNFF